MSENDVSFKADPPQKVRLYQVVILFLYHIVLALLLAYTIYNVWPPLPWPGDRAKSVDSRNEVTAGSNANTNSTSSPSANANANTASTTANANRASAANANGANSNINPNANSNQATAANANRNANSAGTNSNSAGAASAPNAGIDPYEGKLPLLSRSSGGGFSQHSKRG